MKGRVVDTMEFPNYGMKVEIRLNKKSLTFFAYVGNQLLEAKDAETLKSQIHAVVRDGFSATMSGKESIKDKYREYHISTSHSRNGGERIAEDVTHREGKFYCPYSESLWEGLNRLRDAMVEVANRISQLVSTDKGLALLSSGGKLLIEQEEQQDE
jgi:hypothetical protein